MSKKFISMVTMLMLSLGAQAEDDKKCPEDPSEFKGKEDDCFDCLEGALSKLKLFTIEVNKTLEDKKLTSAEEAKSLKTRSDGLWDGVEGWEKICEPKSQPKSEPETEAVAEPETEAVAEPETEAVAEPETETAAEPEAEAVAEPETEAAAGSETEAAAGSETEAAAEPETETAVEPETEAAAEPGAEAAAEPEAGRKA